MFFQSSNRTTNITITFSFADIECTTSYFPSASVAVVVAVSKLPQLYSLTAVKSKNILLFHTCYFTFND